MQVDALTGVGVSPEHLYSEKVSGTKRKGREALEDLLSRGIRKGDTVVVTRLDRLARSSRDLHNIAHKLDEKGVGLKVLEQDIDTTTPAGRLFFTMLGAIAEFETEIRKERQREGIDAAKKLKGTGGGARVSASVTPANVSAESDTIEVTVSPPASATVQSVISVQDVSVSVDGPLEVVASTVGIQGPAGPPGTGSGGSSFLPPPDLLDEEDATFFYYGWADVNGGWLVRRATRASAKKEDATTGYPDLDTAWANRASLAYV